MGVLYVKNNGAWEPVIGGSSDEVFIGPNDPGTSGGYELWYDTDATPPLAPLIATYPDQASLPTTGVTAGTAAITLDQSVMWVWSGTYWRPQAPMVERYWLALSGTIPSGGAAPVQNITINAANYPRKGIVMATALVAGTTGAAYQIQLTAASANLAGPPYGRYYNQANTAQSCHAYGVLDINAGVSPSVGIVVAYASGTTAGGTITNDGRFSYAHVMVQAA